MSMKHLLAIVAALAATGSTFAQQREFVPPEEGFVSTKSRAEVKAELNQVEASGAYGAAGSEEFPGQFAALAGKRPAQTQLAEKSHAEVKEELRKAQASGDFGWVQPVIATRHEVYLLAFEIPTFFVGAG